MKASKDNESLELVYTSIAGTKLYGFKDLTSISAYRGVGAEKAKRFASLSITKEELGKLIKTAIAAVNSKTPNFVEMASICHEINWRLEHICEENSLLELAYIYLLIEGEDDQQPSDEWNKKKAVLAAAEIDLKGFFLRTALQLAQNFSQKPGVDLLTYLEETTATVQARISRFME